MTGASTGLEAGEGPRERAALKRDASGLRMEKRREKMKSQDLT